MSMGFSRQESWRGLPRSPPGYLSYAGIKSKSLTYPALAGRFFTTSTLRMLVFSHPVMLTLCDPMDYITPGHHVLHHLLKFTQVNVHCTVDASQPSHPLMPSSPALNLSQNRGLFQWDDCSHQMTKILELQLQHQSFQQVFRVDFPYDLLVWSPCCTRDFQESSSTTVWRHQFFGILPSLQTSSHNHTWPLGRPQPWLFGSLSAE